MAAIAAVMVAGCNDGRPARVPVSGTVQIDGKPLTSGSVRFTPSDSRPATGTIDENGRFSLSTFSPGDGCVPGKHVVTIHAADSIDEYTLRWNTPKKYSVAETSGITETIVGPTDAIEIKLTWDGKPGPFVERQE